MNFILKYTQALVDHFSLSRLYSRTHFGTLIGSVMVSGVWMDGWMG